MFHVEELRADALSVSAGTDRTTATALAKSLRGRKLAIPLQTSARINPPRAFRFPTKIDGFDILVEAIGRVKLDRSDAFAIVSAVLTRSDRVFAAPLAADGTRTYFVVSVVDLDGEEYCATIQLTQSGGKRGKNGDISRAEVEIFRFEDEVSLAHAVSKHYAQTEDASTYLRARGRSKPAKAVVIAGRIDWLDLAPNWQMELKGAAAAFGYDLEAFVGVNNLGLATKVMDLQPEMVLALESTITSAKILQHVKKRAEDAYVAVESSDSFSLRNEAFAAFSIQPARFVDQDVASTEDLVNALKEIDSSSYPVGVAEKALDSANGCAYSQIDRLISALTHIAEVAQLQSDGSLTNNLAAEFDSRGLSYASDVSDFALGKYRNDYTVSFHGREIVLGPHLKFGSGTPRTCARIYWGTDAFSGDVVIGHVGEHLRGKKG